SLDKLVAHRQTPPPPLSAARPDLPAAVSDLLDRLLAKTPGERPANAAAVADALEPYCADSDPASLMASPETPRAAVAVRQTPTAPFVAPRPHGPFAGSRARQGLALVAAACLVVGVSAAWLLFRRDTPPGEPPIQPAPAANGA